MWALLWSMTIYRVDPSVLLSWGWIFLLVFHQNINKAQACLFHALGRGDVCCAICAIQFSVISWKVWQFVFCWWDVINEIPSNCLGQWYVQNCYCRCIKQAYHQTKRNQRPVCALIDEAEFKLLRSWHMSTRMTILALISIQLINRWSLKAKWTQTCTLRLRVMNLANHENIIFLCHWWRFAISVVTRDWVSIIPSHKPWQMLSDFVISIKTSGWTEKNR